MVYIKPLIQQAKKEVFDDIERVQDTYGRMSHIEIRIDNYQKLKENHLTASIEEVK